MDNDAIGRTFLAVAGSPTRFIAVTTDRDIVWSDDGHVWQPSGHIEPVGILQRAAYGNGRFLVTGTGSVYTSTDGLAWQRTVVPSLTFSDLIFDGTRFIADAHQRGVFHSVDGTTWQPATSVPANAIAVRLVTHAGTTLFNTDGARIYRTTDGVNWTSSNAPFDSEQIPAELFNHHASPVEPFIPAA